MKNSFGLVKIKNVKAKLILLSCLFSIFKSSTAVAQDKDPVTYGKVSVADFKLPPSKAIDSNASAVIIADVGNTSFVGNKNGWVSYVFKRHTRIKIIDKKGIDAATIKIRLYKDGDAQEKLDDVQASSYNLVNGAVVQSKLEKKDIFESKIDKRRIEKKFTLPGVKEDAIIEYSYTITSDFYFNIPEWQFQSIEYPCLWSQYEITIPSLVGYVSLRQGIHPFIIDKTSEGQASYRIKDKAEGNLANPDRDFIVNASTYKRVWAMKEIPAFNVENYISTPYNYVDKIEFQLAKTYNGETTRDVKNTWQKATEELLHQADFGEPLQPDNSDFAEQVNKIVGNEVGDLEKARKIYYYVRDNFTCTDFYSKYITTTLTDVFKKKQGNVGEINLLLAVMLRNARIHADPVLLSTTEFGFNSPYYPIMDRLNYVICRVPISSSVYYLDAAKSMLGFGKLAANCYNGHARIICEKDSGSVYFRPDSVKDSKLTSVFIINDEKGNGEMSGAYQSSPGYFESTLIREKGEKEYFRNMIQNTVDIKIDSPSIDSLKQYDLPVKIRFGFSYKNNTDQDIIYFSP
ncbi:MAG TPA: transglutaminase domain-containing protein, partial [Puia sp.]|nr:transglutaminase domain-containing protein [Puia sp.]